MKIDSAAMHAMFVRKVSCNAALADHPTVQVGDDPLNVGLTGLLNGICGVNADGCGPLVSIWSSDNRLLGFTVPERSKYPEVGG